MSGSLSRSKAKALAVWGTSSNVGKSFVAAGLCRLLRDSGVNVAPFKAQNMSNNSAVTADGKEIGRAQACQAEACRILAGTDMNPLLLKPTGDTRSQVVLQGKVDGSAGEEFGFDRLDGWKQRISESYDRLANAYEVIVIEGAGSCAELNLRERDLANTWIARHADAHVLLIADIERGGVFASVLGTLDLLEPADRRRVIGIVINKFRGSTALFDEGKKMIEERSGLPVLGVLPYVWNHGLADEDSVSFYDRKRERFNADDNRQVRVGVIVPPHISNTTDFEAMERDGRFDVRYLERVPLHDDFDIAILPGSKNTISDLTALRDKGFASFLSARKREGKFTLGICGGYQMLGKAVCDPYSVESVEQLCEGFGLLDVETTLERAKTTVNVEGVISGTDVSITGYEIHCGTTNGNDTERPFVNIQKKQDQSIAAQDGARSGDGNVFGTYIHGIFDRSGFRDELAKRFGATGNGSNNHDPYDVIAGNLKKHLDMEPVFHTLGLMVTT